MPEKTTCHGIRSRGQKTFFGQCQWRGISKSEC